MVDDKKKPVVTASTGNDNGIIKDLIGSWEGNPKLRKSVFLERGTVEEEK